MNNKIYPPSEPYTVQNYKSLFKRCLKENISVTDIKVECFLIVHKKRSDL